MRGQAAHGIANDSLDIAQETIQLLFANSVGQRMVAAGLNALSQHDLQPGNFGEQFIEFAMDTSIGAKQVDTPLER